MSYHMTSLANVVTVNGKAGRHNHKIKMTMTTFFLDDDATHTLTPYSPAFMIHHLKNSSYVSQKVRF